MIFKPTETYYFAGQKCHKERPIFPCCEASFEAIKTLGVALPSELTDLAAHPGKPAAVGIDAPTAEEDAEINRLEKPH